MKALAAVLTLALTLAAPVFGQGRRAVVRASADASVSVNPDQAMISVAVVTTATTAQEASNQNAAQVSSVLAAVKPVAGSGAEIKTVGYTLYPNYSTPRDSTPAVIVNYTATNTIQVTTGDLAAIGKIIDTAIGAGANRVQGLSFGLKDQQPTKTQALRSAAARDKTAADAIATGLGMRTGAVLIAEEGSSVSISANDTRLAGGAGAATPIEPGLVVVRATVAVEVEMFP